MVKLSRFTAVNPHEEAGDGGTRMLEAAEAELIQLYQTAIADSLTGNVAKCETALRSLLENDLVVGGATEQLQQLRVLSMKNLAITVLKQEGRDREALGLLKAAIDSSPGQVDVGLVDKFGTLAARLGEWSAAKDAFSWGLSHDPTHCTMKMKLREVLVHLDNQGALAGDPSSQRLMRTLLPDLPEVSRKPLPISFGMDVRQKINVNVADWIGLLRQTGHLREVYGMGCPRIEIRVDVSDNDIEIDLDLDDDDDEAGEEERGKNGGVVGWTVLPKDDVVSTIDRDHGDDTVMLGGSESAILSPDIIPTTNLPALTEDSAPSENPSQASRRTRQQAANGREGGREREMTRKTVGMNILEELQGFLRDPSPRFNGEVDASLGIDDDGVRSVLPSSEPDGLLWSCIGVDWPLDALYNLLMVYFSQSKDLVKLKDADAKLLIDIAEAADQWLPLNNAITIAEWVVEKFCDIKDKSLGALIVNDASKADLRRLQELAKRLLLRVAVELVPGANREVPDGTICVNGDDTFTRNSNNGDFLRVEGETKGGAVVGVAAGNTIATARYLFAKGKLMQALDHAEQAKECFSVCLGVVIGGNIRLRLDHLRDHNMITAPCVRFILESVDVQSEMGKIRSQSEGKSGLQERLVALSTKVLSGQETESLMLGVDPSGWKNTLSALIDASVKNDNTSTSLRCQIRLLHAILPKGTPEEVCEARQNPNKFLEPLFKGSFTARLLDATQLDRVIYGVALEEINLDNYELDMLRDVLRRLLVTMHACHTCLCLSTEPARAIHDRGFSKYCGAILAHMSAFFMALLTIEMIPDSNGTGSNVVPTLERLFQELGQLNLLVVRRSMVPYFATPLLCQIHSKMDDKAPNAEILEDLIFAMLKLAFNLSLTQSADLLSDSVSLDGLRPRPITSEHEVRTIWPICAGHFASFSGKRLKENAGHFVEECYAVAESCLPIEIKAHMASALQKCGLQRPGNVCSSDLNSPFLPLRGVPLVSMAPGGGKGGGNSVRTDWVISGTTVDPDLHRMFASIFDTKIKNKPIDFGAIDKVRDILAVEPLERETYPYLWSLAFCPENAGHWFAIGSFYLKIVDKVNDLYFLEGRHPTADESAEVRRRRNVAYWCLNIAGACADKELASCVDGDGSQRDVLGGMFEFYGRALLAESTECAEMGGSREFRRMVLREALSAFIAATRFSPSKYSNHMHIGVCSKLLGHHPRIHLPALAHACELAKLDPRGTTFIDPLFELHAARMELLENGEEGMDDETRSLCSLYIFSSANIVGSAQMGSIHSAELLDLDISAIYNDAVDAMEWCIEANRSYYKPSLRMAMSPLTDIRARCDHLDLLFSSNKSGDHFAFGMSQVREKGPHMQKAQRAKRRRPPSTSDSSYHGIGSQALAESNVFQCKRYPVAACPAAMKPTAKNLGIGSSGTDTLRGHILVTTRRALLEYVAVLRALSRQDKLEEIAAFLEKSDTDWLKMEEFTDIIAYCRAGRMMISLESAFASFSPRYLSDARADAFLPVCPSENDGVLPHSHFDAQLMSHPESRANLERLYEIYLESCSCTIQERVTRVLQPAAKYMRWRLSRGDLSDVDELGGKMLVTNQGLDLLGRYACIYVRSLANNIDEVQGDDCNPCDLLIQRYTEFLQRVTSVRSRTGLLGLVLLSHVYQLCKKTNEINEKCLLHAQECVQPPKDAGDESTSDQLAALRSFVKESILPDLNRDEMNTEECDEDIEDVDDTDGPDGNHREDGKDCAGADREGSTDTEPQGGGGIASMAIAAVFTG